MEGFDVFFGFGAGLGAGLLSFFGAGFGAGLLSFFGVGAGFAASFLALGVSDLGCVGLSLTSFFGAGASSLSSDFVEFLGAGSGEAFGLAGFVAGRRASSICASEGCDAAGVGSGLLPVAQADSETVRQVRAAISASLVSFITLLCPERAGVQSVYVGTGCYLTGICTAPITGNWKVKP